MRFIKLGLRVLLALVLFLSVHQTSSKAFFKRHSKPEKSSFFYAQTEEYKIIFSFSLPPEAKFDKARFKNSVLDLHYKLVSLMLDPMTIFKKAPALRVRFLDKEGFALAQDEVLPVNFNRGECYGFLKVEPVRARDIVTADIVALSPDQTQNTKIDPASLSTEKQAAVIENGNLSASISEPSAEKAPNPEIYGTLLETLGILWPRANGYVLNPPSEKVIQPASISNEDVKARLAEFEKQIPTEIPKELVPAAASRATANDNPGNGN